MENHMHLSGLLDRGAGFQSNDTRIWRLITAPSSCPGGTSDNSPTFQRWEPVPNVALVPKRRPKLCARSAVPSGLKAFYSQLPNVETLGYCRMSLRDEDQIRVIECGNPRNPVRVASSRWASASWLDKCNPFRVEAHSRELPRVASRAAGQPRAEGYNPFGIGII
jgi:hypothetical protein